MLLKLGTITKTVGLKGEVRIYSTTNLAERRYKKGNKILIGDSENQIEVTIKTYRKQNSDFDIISFEEYPTIEAAETLLKKDIFVEKANNVLKNNEYFYIDLEKCEIFADNQFIGRVVKVEEFPAQITLRCKSKDDKEFFIPFIPVFIKNVNIEESRIDINLIEGML